jgi:hypothetical protein
MELVIFNPQIPEMIKFNNEELINELTEKLGHYNSLTYTDAEIKTAKADRATLNKFKLAIDNRRKEIKTQCMAPYNDFESKVKQIITLIDQPILAIDTQVKTYEQKVKTEKRAEIITFFNESVGYLAEFLPIEKVWIEKWLNTSESTKNIKEDIMLVIDRVKNDLEIIAGLQSEFELQIREVYLQKLNLSSALQWKVHLEGQKSMQEAYNKAQAERREQERVKAEERALAEAQRVEELRLAREEERQQVEALTFADAFADFSEPIPEPEPVVVVPEVTEDKSYEVLDVGNFESSEECAIAMVVDEVLPALGNAVDVVRVDLSVWVTPDLLEALEGFLEAYEIKYAIGDIRKGN